MTRLEKAILQVKETRLHENRPWIYDENEKLKKKPFVETHYVF